VDHWPHSIVHYGIDEVLMYVRDNEWQNFRLSLKGLPTTEKLQRLSQRRQDKMDHLCVLPRQEQVRIDNYINALKRGGQLAIDGRVQR